MWFWCFAWLVGLLCACVVRRIRGLWRVCLPFVLLPFFFCLSFHLFTCFCPSPCLLCSGCLLLVLLSCLVCSCGLCVFFFPYGLHAKRKGAKVLPLASSLGVWVVVLDVFEHYRYLLRSVVTISSSFAYDSSNFFGLFYWVFYYLPVFVDS